MNGRFPVGRHQTDFRFGFGLTADVAHVLSGYGFPNIMSFYDGAPVDFDRLQRMLHAYLYTAADTSNETEPELIIGTGQDVHLSDGGQGTPVEFRLIGGPDAVAHVAEVLGHVFTVFYQSEFYDTKGGRSRVYLTGSRVAPYRGGLK